MADSKTPAPTENPVPTPDPVAETDATTHLAALAAAGSFVEQRVSRGQHAHGEREASDEIMTEIAKLLNERK